LINIRSLLEHLDPHTATLLVGFVSALIPIVNIELFLLAAAAIASTSFPVWTLGIVAAVGQMIGKTLWYWSAGAALDSRPGRRFAPERVAALRLRMAAMNAWVLSGLSFGSALTGFPPFLLFSILAGAVRMKYWRFAATGLAGRCLRLVAIVSFPHAIKRLFS